MLLLIWKSIKLSRSFVLRSIDLQKPCDCIPRTHIWSVLAGYEISRTFLKSIKCLLVNSRKVVRVEKNYSFIQWFGTCQGCTISLLLFLIYVDNIILSANLRGKAVLRNNLISALAYDFVLLGNFEKESDGASINGIKTFCAEEEYENT